MIVEPVAAASVGALTPMGTDQFLPTAKAEVPVTNFGNWFSNELTSVNESLVNADTDIKKMAVGDAQNLHEVMIHLEEARLSFQLLVQVRNRLLEAYQEVMRMQV